MKAVDTDRPLPKSTHRVAGLEVINGGWIAASRDANSASLGRPSICSLCKIATAFRRCRRPATAAAFANLGVTLAYQCFYVRI